MSKSRNTKLYGMSLDEDEPSMKRLTDDDKIGILTDNDASDSKKPKIDFTNCDTVVDSVLKTLRYELSEEEKELETYMSTNSMEADNIDTLGSDEKEETMELTRSKRARGAALLAIVEQTRKEINEIEQIGKEEQNSLRLSLRLERQLLKQLEVDPKRVLESEDDLQKLAESVRPYEEGWMQKMEGVITSIGERAPPRVGVKTSGLPSQSALLNLTCRVCALCQTPSQRIAVCMFVGDRMRMNILHRYAVSRNMMDMVIKPDLVAEPHD